jgi:1,4-alpha-glucan branching enzyme
VPAHFPRDAHGLAEFDGTALYEHADPKQGWHPDWDTNIFNYGRTEVRSFLLSSAMFWIEEFHADGLRVDAVASMIYRDYSRKDGEWVPNERGGRENDEAESLLQKVNETLYARHPGILMIAEESTAWPGVSRPTKDGGLGFGFKWDMGWMHDTLQHFEREPVHRQYHRDELTFRSVYASSENYMLALSHDEVVHGKRPLLTKLPGDRWQQFANNRLLWAYQATQPGKSLIFMGMEFGQTTEWNHDEALPWNLLEHAQHVELLRWTAALNKLVVGTPALHERDCHEDGTRWLQSGRAEDGVMVAARFADDGSAVVVCLNFTPIARQGFRVGVPSDGLWLEVLNSDDLAFGGTGLVYDSPRAATAVPAMGEDHSVEVLVPPLGAVFLARARTQEAETER